jgi:phosphoribosylanthranilate isomerase
MSMVKVKICGITRKEDLLMASEAGADAVGVVVNVPSSPRSLTIGKAKEIIENAPIFVKTVAVTVPENIDQLVEIYEKLKPNIIQIHGGNLPASAIREKLPYVSIIRAIHAVSNEAIKEAVEAANTFDAVLLDSFVSGKYGGTGEVHDWKVSRKVRETIYPKPLILAGGLTPENVKEAIRMVQPYAVDVSSGVESQPGIKDSEKVSAFVKACKECYCH